jgi:hypothetical protein
MEKWKNGKLESRLLSLVSILTSGSVLEIISRKRKRK